MVWLLPSLVNYIVSFSSELLFLEPIYLAILIIHSLKTHFSLLLRPFGFFYLVLFHLFKVPGVHTVNILEYTYSLAELLSLDGLLSALIFYVYAVLGSLFRKTSIRSEIWGFSHV